MIRVWTKESNLISASSNGAADGQSVLSLLVLWSTTKDLSTLSMGLETCDSRFLSYASIK